MEIGKRSKITRGSKVLIKGKARFGANTFITARGGQIFFGGNFSGSQDVIYNCDIGGTLSFGDYCLVGPRCIFRTTNHNFSSLETPIRLQGHIAQNIMIGDDVWFGANSIVLPGVTIGNHVVIGAGSVVTTDIPDYSVAVGNPAKVIKNRTGN